MLTVQQAQEMLLNHCLPGQVPCVEEVVLLEAQGRVLAEDVVSHEDYPAYDRSSMDGYAVNSLDTVTADRQNPLLLQTQDYVACGHEATEPLRPGFCIPIATGAPLPAGADAVIRFEEVQEGRGAVGLTRPVPAGENVSPRGEDIQKGQVVLRKGQVIGSPEIGVLATLGHARVTVVRRPRVAVLPTGDELVSVEVTPGPAQVRQSTGYALAAAARECGCEVDLLDSVGDDLTAITGALEDLDAYDLVMTTGGASVGRRDLIRKAFREIGAEELFWRVAMKPGKNIATAQRGRVLYFGLSGNPASALITFDVVMRPLLAQLSGMPGARLIPVTARLAAPLPRKKGYPRYLRVRFVLREGVLWAEPSLCQLGSVLSSLTQAHGLIHVSPAEDPLPAGAAVEAWLFPTAATAIWEGAKSPP